MWRPKKTRSLSTFKRASSHMHLNFKQLLRAANKLPKSCIQRTFYVIRYSHEEGKTSTYKRTDTWLFQKAFRGYGIRSPHAGR